MLEVGLAHAPIYCKEAEFISFEPPSGQSCAAYIENYIQYAGGQLQDQNATSNCRLCPATTTDTFLASLNLDYGQRWRNFGLLLVYIAFNIAAALFFYWLARVPKKTKSKEMVAEDALLRQKTRQSTKEGGVQRTKTRASEQEVLPKHSPRTSDAVTDEKHA